MMTVETERWWAALVVLVTYTVLCVWVTWRYRIRKLRSAQAVAAMAATSADAHAPMLVAYASQTGQAEELAWQTAKSLASAGVPSRVLALSELGLDELKQASRALFVVSTYGEGDPPDNAALFMQRVMGQALDASALSGLSYALLALGDTEYQHYCGFGRLLDEWLQTQGAQAWCDRIEVDDGCEEALTRWRQQLGHIAGVSDLSDWASAPYQAWSLLDRKHLNPGSQGRPTYHLVLVPPVGEVANWAAGDLVQVIAPEGDGRPREYSIASVPEDGALHLLVRLAVREDGQLGTASGWLTQGLNLGARVNLRLRVHSNFRANGSLHRPMILIGNGTGLAGLRAHLKARILGGMYRNWLVFGERQSHTDFYHQDELTAWQQAGQLHLSAVFSRDQSERLYVQDVVRQERLRLHQWVSEGAVIYVCGSLQGMASGVHEALTEVLGIDGMALLIEQGRYRRDVY